jgi:hypothetical protein
VLVALISGDSGYDIESLSDTNILDESLAHLKAMYGREDLPAVSSYQVFNTRVWFCLAL